jgi:hypothetical protein
MRLLVITSCTGEKRVGDNRALTLEDFQKGAAYVASRERDFVQLLTPAEDLYTGQQHVRLMRGVRAFRERLVASGAAARVDLWVLSAGYGVVPADRKLAPYECTFQGMKRRALRSWADTLNVPKDIRSLLIEPYDLGLVLLGDAYVEACALDDSVALGGPTLLFCSKRVAKGLPRIEGMRAIVLTNAETRRFSCGLVGLKGEIAGQILGRVAEDPHLVSRLLDPAFDVFGLLDGAGPQSRSSRAAARANPEVDRVIDIPRSWWEKPHRQRLCYFIPEWDDLVDPDYDFESDIHSGGMGDWSNEVYAHQLYSEPNYDGILVSKVIAEKSTKKKARINALGVHRFLRVPPEFPVMGDCGAFGYIRAEVPPYTTEEILDYYTRLGFDYGVSIDHLIVTATEAEKQLRYEVTIHNAEEFLLEHRKRGLRWEPVGAVQGWDPQSYAKAARQYVLMGYRYIGLGGLVRSGTPEILRILDEVHRVVPESVSIHLFGLARLRVLIEFTDLGVRSVDSASFLRRAWMGTGQNYLTLSGDLYTAIRIPEAGKSFRAKRIVTEGRALDERVDKLEVSCIRALGDFDRGELSVETTLDVIEEYDRLITPDRPDTRPLLRRTLEARPWKDCPCEICLRDGVQVIIFRGNNRNRRRGFHNTYVFYRLLQCALAGEPATLVTENDEAAKSQMAFFEKMT